MPALTSGRYHIKWTQLADLPVPLYDTYVAVQHHKIYVTGIDPVEDALHQVYVYNINDDQWGQLPPSGHYLGIPHIIGGRLAIIGGRDLQYISIWQYIDILIEYRIVILCSTNIEISKCC